MFAGDLTGHEAATRTSYSGYKTLHCKQSIIPEGVTLYTTTSHLVILKNQSFKKAAVFMKASTVFQKWILAISRWLQGIALRGRCFEVV